MKNRIYRSSLLMIALAIASITTAQTRPTYREIAVQNGGTISGTVRLPNYKEEPVLVPVQKDAKHCGEKKGAGCSGVSKDGLVANAVVYLEGITQGKKLIANDATVVLDQKNCEYTPHVVVVPVGSNLEVVNSDPILHNVHAYNLQKPPVSQSVQQPPTEFNIAMPLKGQKISRQMKEPGMFMTLCDAGHPWMSAHVVVADHPYYSVTDAAGKFTLTDVPPGKYKIRVWHEGSAQFANGRFNFLSAKPYVMQRDVTVPAKGNVNVNFDLK